MLRQLKFVEEEVMAGIENSGCTDEV